MSAPRRSVQHGTKYPQPGAAGEHNAQNGTSPAVTAAVAAGRRWALADVTVSNGDATGAPATDLCSAQNDRRRASAQAPSDAML